MYQLKLKADGFRVLLVSDGEKAFELAVESPPDILLLDIRLPRMDGLELLAKLRDNPRTEQLPVVVLSSHSDPELVERGRSLGVIKWLDKSHTMPAALAEMVAAWTARVDEVEPPPDIA
jgi:CheY-like chemotaxis protein